MNKQDLVTAVSEKTTFSKKDSEKAINAVFDSISECLAEGDKVQLVGFGSFEVKDRKAKTGLNPKTKEKIDIPATKAPVFKAGKVLKNAVMPK